ncbi:hypothetical protein PLUTE_b0187 [Pseudoalteromonas luteoviolacea DSM 6061]|nr:hypothetical protein [Pseudoalteromonas luteoviolacea DSM 6061]
MRDKYNAHNHFLSCLLGSEPMRDKYNAHNHFLSCLLGSELANNRI